MQATVDSNRSPLAMSSGCFIRFDLIGKKGEGGKGIYSFGGYLFIFIIFHVITQWMIDLENPSFPFLGLDCKFL